MVLETIRYQRLFVYLYAILLLISNKSKNGKEIDSDTTISLTTDNYNQDKSQHEGLKSFNKYGENKQSLH
jgi:hypothetical protein